MGLSFIIIFLYRVLSFFACPYAYYFFYREDEYLAITHITRLSNFTDYFHDFLDIFVIHHKLDLGFREHVDPVLACAV
jgi:hypothetical protein